MQRGGEDGALDRKLERAVLQQAGQDIGDAEPAGINQRSGAFARARLVPAHWVGDKGLPATGMSVMFT